MRRLALLAVLLLPSSALAGGSNVAVVSAGTAVWITAAPWTLAVDSRSGRIRRRVPVANAYPIELARGGGAIWVGSVENGFVAGAVTRIGAAWAIVGPWRRARLVRIDFATGRTRAVPLAAGRPQALAGDGTTAVVVTSGGRLYRLTRGAPVPVGVVPRTALPLAADRDGVWVASGGSVSWVDLRDGRSRVILEGVVADLAVYGGEAYALRSRPAGMELIRFDEDGGRVYARRPLPRSAVHVAAGGGAVWVTESSATATLVRLNRRTLAIQAAWDFPG